MAEIRKGVRENLSKLLPNRGYQLEQFLYDKNMLLHTEQPGWDFYSFRRTYKQTAHALLDMLECYPDVLKMWKESLSINQLHDIIFEKQEQQWHPSLWAHTEESVKDAQELRNGTFTCSNCQKKNMYARNTSHYEKQTRSADEPMTVFLHCHTCGKDYRFSS